MRHRRRDRERWEQIVELTGVGMLAIPTSLVVFSAELLWQDDVLAGFLLLAGLTFPPLGVVWAIEHRRGRPRASRTE